MSGLSGLDPDRANPRQSFRPHLQGNQCLARDTARGSLRIDLHAIAESRKSRFNLLPHLSNTGLERARTQGSNGCALQVRRALIRQVCKLPTLPGNNAMFLRKWRILSKKAAR